MPVIREITDSYIKQQIQETFGFMDGKVISYQTRYASGSGEWNEDGKARMVKFSTCREIKTDGTNEYLLVISYYDENDFETDLVGIFGISFAEVNQNNTGTDSLLKELRIDA